MSIYLRAAQIIKERGWYKGNFTGPGGECCLAGAIGLAAGMTEKELHDKWGNAPEAKSAIDSICHAIGEDYLADWNDNPDRTEQDVLNLLERLHNELEDQDEVAQ